MTTQFCKDFSFISNYLELELALQKIQEILFTTNNNKISNFVVCPKHTQELQNKFHLHSTKNPIECYQIGKHSGSLDELEELRNLVVKETEGSREIQNTIPI
jgi:hypothetical protein